MNCGNINQYLDIHQLKIPSHIAIIMDGNGRWAQERGLPRVSGHKAGVNALKEIIIACSDLNIKVLSLYAFSTENWKRPKEEVNALMNLLVSSLKKEIEELNKNNIKIRVIGEKEGLPENVRKEVIKAEERTKNNTGLILNVALNYGGRKEIIHCVKEVCKKVINNELAIEDIDENTFSQMLYTSGLPDPDLIIRASGELRLSNFLLWQSAYSEFWFTPVYWPDFKKEHLIQAIIDYQRRNRRFGSIQTEVEE